MVQTYYGTGICVFNSQKATHLTANFAFKMLNLYGQDYSGMGWVLFHGPYACQAFKKVKEIILFMNSNQKYTTNNSKKKNTLMM